MGLNHPGVWMELAQPSRSRPASHLLVPAGLALALPGSPTCQQGPSVLAGSRAWPGIASLSHLTLISSPDLPPGLGLTQSVAHPMSSHQCPALSSACPGLGSPHLRIPPPPPSPHLGFQCSGRSVGSSPLQAFPLPSLVCSGLPGWQPLCLRIAPALPACRPCLLKT